MTQVLLWLGTALLALLAARGLMLGHFRKYPVFFGYIVYVLLINVAGFFLLLMSAVAYQYFYWTAVQLIGPVIGFAIIWEIYAQVLAPYAGVRRFARVVLAAVLLVPVFDLALGLTPGSGWGGAPSRMEVARDARALQAALLVAIVAALLYYRIPLGRNVRGIVLGYSFFVGASVMNLALRTELGMGFQRLWGFTSRITYVIALAIWCTALWSYAPNPRPANDNIESDYELLAGRTVKAMARVRQYLFGMVRP